MVSEVSVVTAFVGGLISFLSPCVLPIIPGFLAYLAGTSVSHSGAPSRLNIFLASLFFVIGFSSVFSVIGVFVNTLLSYTAGNELGVWLSRIGGAVIIAFGLFLMGLIRIPYLEREHRISVRRRFHSRALTSFLFGAAFAAGWSPCVGAVLGAILGLAASAPGSAFVLLFSYSLGLGLPFLLVGVFASQAGPLILRITPALHPLTRIFGAVLVALGVLAFTQSLNLLLSFDILSPYFI